MAFLGGKAGRLAAPALIVVSLVLFMLSGAITAGPPQEESDNYPPILIDTGDLPGVTWADDVHPIFVRNRCGLCHTRGREYYVDELEKFALGLIDPENPQNAFHSYHELVYAQMNPSVRKGETLRDGQCCWPSGADPDMQRRIWTGHAGRSAVMRKLERDYFDWTRPPRFVEEGLRLGWGLPMPWVREQDENGGHDHIEVRSLIVQAALYLKAWLGIGEPEIKKLPPMISSRDRMVLRYWIDNALELEKDGTRISVVVVDKKGRHTPGASVYLVGNLNNNARREVYDRLALATDRDGLATLDMPRGSVVTSYWFASAEKGTSSSGYVPVALVPGEASTVVVRIDGGR